MHNPGFRTRKGDRSSSRLASMWCIYKGFYTQARTCTRFPVGGGGHRRGTALANPIWTVGTRNQKETPGADCRGRFDPSVADRTNDAGKDSNETRKHSTRTPMIWLVSKGRFARGSSTGWATSSHKLTYIGKSTLESWWGGHDQRMKHLNEVVVVCSGEHAAVDRERAERRSVLAEVERVQQPAHLLYRERRERTGPRDGACRDAHR